MLFILIIVHYFKKFENLRLRIKMKIKDNIILLQECKIRHIFCLYFFQSDDK